MSSAAANINAIDLMLQIDGQSRMPTDAEVSVLQGYSGWGALAAFFDETNQSHDAERQRLIGLVGVDEFESMRASVLDAYYTPDALASAMWAGIERLGGGKGLYIEPSVGTGVFARHAPSGVWLTGVDKDQITARICALSNTNINVINRPFERVRFQDMSFFGAIGNPPYLNLDVTDRYDTDIKGPIHSFMIAKAMKKVSAGGVGAFVVTHYLLDGDGSNDAMKWLRDNVRLVDAFRLPNTVFKPGAEVVTDVLFLQRCRGDEITPNDSDWFGATSACGSSGESAKISRYFDQHPDRILGESFIKRDRFNKLVWDVRPGKVAWDVSLANGIAALPQNIVGNVIVAEEHDPSIDVNDRMRTKVFGYAYDCKTGDLVSRLPDHADERRWRRVSGFGETQLARIKAMLDLRDLLVDLVEIETATTDHGETREMNEARQLLRSAYDAFLKKFGPIHGVGNRNVFSRDPSYSLICSLELDYDPGISKAVAKREGGAYIPPKWELAQILSKRAILPLVDDSVTAKSPSDALVASLRKFGRVRLDFMSNISGVSKDELIGSLSTSIICSNPVAGSWVLMDEYLSGNVVEKLAEAKESAKFFPFMARNVELLSAVQPKPIDPIDIYTPVNAAWLPGDVVADFIEYMINFRPSEMPFSVGSAWHIKLDKWSGNQVKSRSTWGTEDYPFGELFLAMMNNKAIVVREPDGQGGYVVNRDASAAAQEKADEIRLEWEDWLWSSSERRERLGAMYNARFNTHVERKYDGSFLFNPDGSLPGASPEIKFEKHQQNAVWRGVVQNSLLLDHRVGAGKTFVAIATAEIERRMGITRKPIFAVPNILIHQWASQYTRLYPNANVLCVSQDDLRAGSRDHTVAVMAFNSWDAIIVAHDSLPAITSAPEFQTQFMDTMIDGIMDQIDAAKKENGSRATVRALETQKARVEKRFEKILARTEKRKTDTMTLQQIGSTKLIIDEWHSSSKNLTYFTAHNNVLGLGPVDGSGRAFDAFVKAQSLLSGGRGGKLQLLTGTVVSNSFAELFHVLRFLAYREMEDRGIHQFDAWASVFAEPIAAYEMTMLGSYAMKTRFRFQNMEDLMTLYRCYADVITKEDLEKNARAKGVDSGVPRIAGGAPCHVTVERSEAQEKLIGGLLDRASNLGSVDRTVDNALKIFSDARKIAILPRLFSSNFDPSEGAGKIEAMIERVVKHHREWDSRKGTQLIFLDMGTPRQRKSAVVDAKSAALVALATCEDGDVLPDVENVTEENADFVLYEHIKFLLSKHIPAEQIAFIHDAKTDSQRAKLFRDMNSGKIRVMLASTMKGGAGTNVQERLVALHDLDAPIRPSDLEQRLGRIERRGNLFYAQDPAGFEIHVYRYGTKLTLDALFWSHLEIKQRMIEQIRKGATGKRTFEDIEGSSVSFASMKAELSGNPLVLRQFQIQDRVTKLERAERNHRRNIWATEDFLDRNSGFEDLFAIRFDHLEKDLMEIASHGDFSLTVRGNKIPPEKIKDVLADEINLASRMGSKLLSDGVLLGLVNGLKLTMTMREAFGTTFSLKGSEFSGSTHYESGKMISTPGLVVRLKNILSDAAPSQLRLHDLLAKRRAEVAEAQIQVKRSFPSEAELTALRSMLRRVNQALEKNETAIDDDMMHQISVLLGVPNSTASQAASKVEFLPNVARRGGGVARRRVA